MDEDGCRSARNAAACGVGLEMLTVEQRICNTCNGSQRFRYAKFAVITLVQFALGEMFKGNCFLRKNKTI